MDKEEAIPVYKGILFGHKNEWSSDTGYNMGVPRKHTKWKKPETEDHIL